MRFRVIGNTKRLRKILKKLSTSEIEGILNKYASTGVRALSSATPKDSGKTAASWDYRIVPTNEGYSIEYLNTNINDGVNIAIILQTGHGTGTGGYVQGRDYINPAAQKVFDQIVEDIIKEVRNSG